MPAGAKPPPSARGAFGARTPAKSVRTARRALPRRAKRGGGGRRATTAGVGLILFWRFWPADAELPVDRSNRAGRTRRCPAHERAPRLGRRGSVTARGASRLWWGRRVVAFAGRGEDETDHGRLKAGISGAAPSFERRGRREGPEDSGGSGRPELWTTASRERASGRRRGEVEASPRHAGTS